MDKKVVKNNYGDCCLTFGSLPLYLLRSLCGVGNNVCLNTFLEICEWSFHLCMFICKTVYSLFCHICKEKLHD